MVEDSKFLDKTLQLFPEDVLVFYTDGVTEAIDPRGEQYGVNRLAELVGKAGNYSAKDLIDTLRQALNDFSEGNPLPDDTTIVACRILG